MQGRSAGDVCYWSFGAQHAGGEGTRGGDQGKAAAGRVSSGERGTGREAWQRRSTLMVMTCGTEQGEEDKNTTRMGHVAIAGGGG